MRTVVLLTLSLLACTPATSAQPVRLEDDVLVRATVDGRRLTGRLRRAGDGAFVVVLPTDTLALTDVERLDVRARRTRGKGAGRGALIGVGVGLVGAGLVTAIAAADCSDEPNATAFLTCDALVLILGVYLGGSAALGGALVGAVLGSAAPGRRWVPVDDVRVGLAPVRGRPGVGLAVRF